MDRLERFYRGRLVRVQPGARTGAVVTASGREIPFSVGCVRVVGTDRGFAGLRDGMRVGYDVGRTAAGLRITTICVDEPSEPVS